MKYLGQFRSILIVKLILLSLISYAQVDFQLSIEKRNMSKGEQVGYMIEIPQADLNTVKKNWIKLLQEETKEKAIVTDHEIFVKDAVIKEIVQKPINIYSYVYKVDTIIRIYSFFEIDSVFFEYSGSESDIAGEKILNGITNFKRKFAINQYIIAVNDEMETEQKNLKVLQSDLKKLQKQNESYHKEIEVNKQNISESNDELNMLDKDNERLMSSITEKRSEISSISDKDQKKAENKVLKDLESEKKKVGNRIEKEKTKIVEYESAIEIDEKNIEKNLELQKAKEAEIEAKEEEIKVITQKMDGIK